MEWLHSALDTRLVKHHTKKHEQDRGPLARAAKAGKRLGVLCHQWLTAAAALKEARCLRRWAPQAREKRRGRRVG